MFRPSYHAQTGDCNTVLFYFKEDDDYNNSVDRDNPGLSLETKNLMYRRYFFSFDNTDCNGRFTHDFANHGKVDLRPLAWEPILRGAFELAYYNAVQNRYLASSGGVLELREGDDTYNNLNRIIIQAFWKMNGKAFIGNINYYDEDREKVVAYEKSVFTAYNGEKVLNFGAAFIIPEADDTLDEMIRRWNTSGEQTVANIEAIVKRIEWLGGKNLIWY